ncbi:MAG: hypothetical protein MZV65_32095 [Chromatiales bacterium]|nr:hypothetical protein [Chromatiales bacterium]
MPCASYETAAKRLDSIDNRLQTLLAFVAAVSVAVPSIAHARGCRFSPLWFYGAVTLFALRALCLERSDAWLVECVS